jgi:hypothetical protein
MKSTTHNNFTKREFLRQCAYWWGGFALGAFKSNCSSYLRPEEEIKIVEGGSKSTT